MLRLNLKQNKALLIVGAVGSALLLCFYKSLSAVTAIAFNSAVQASKYPANVAALLAAIRSAEGTAGPNGYRTMFGGSLFTSFADHPGKYFTHTQTNGKVIRTSAAGAYQFILPTWQGLKKRLNLPDFSPSSQDAAAVQLIRDRGAYADLLAGNLVAVLLKLSPVWASLPHSTASQPHVTVAKIAAVYQQAGGKIA